MSFIDLASERKFFDMLPLKIHAKRLEYTKIASENFGVFRGKLNWNYLKFEGKKENFGNYLMDLIWRVIERRKIFDFQFQELGKVLRGGKVTEIMGGASPKLGRGLKWIDTRSACRIWVRSETLPKGLDGPGGEKCKQKKWKFFGCFWKMTFKSKENRWSRWS